MTCRWIRSLSLMVAVGFLDVRLIKAEVISQDNPYRSYNISGVNYASMQWERSHIRKSSSTRNRNNGWLIRRNSGNLRQQVLRHDKAA